MIVSAIAQLERDGPEGGYHRKRRSELRWRLRQRRGIDAFAHPVVHRHVAYGVHANFP
jgi:hypothetical protein